MHLRCWTCLPHHANAKRSQCFGNLAAAAPGTPRIESGSPMDNTLAGIDSKTSSPDGSHHNNSLDFGPGQDRNEDSSNSLAPDFKASFPHDQHWEQPPFHGYQVEPVQPAQTPEDQKPTRGKQPDAPKLRELADAATAASHTPGQSKPRNESRSGASKPQSSRRNSIMEDPQKRILGPISNLIASSINQGAANESLDKAVLRALLELEKNKNIITPANHRRNLSLKEDRSSKNAERPPPGFGGPDGTETTISTAEVLQGLAALSKRIRQSARKPNPIVNSRSNRSQGFKCPDCPKVLARQCDMK